MIADDNVDYVGCDYGDVPLDEANIVNTADDSMDVHIGDKADDMVVAENSCKKDVAVAEPAVRSAAADRVQTDIVGYNSDSGVSFEERADSLLVLVVAVFVSLENLV